jgi:hypothetical protein
MQKTLFSIAALLFFGLMVQSCRKDSSVSDTDKMTAEDLMAHNDLSEQMDDDAAEAVDNFVSGETEDRGDCPTVTFAQPKGTWPNTITLDYSDAGCTKNGRTYQGKLIINQTDDIKVLGASRTFTFDNFFIEGVKIEGTKTVTNAGLNVAGVPSFNISADEKLTFPNGDQATHVATRTRTMSEGFGTSTRLDDVWTIEGGASGINRNGVAYTVSITKALVKRNPCAWIGEGTIEFIKDNVTRSLDFGDGSCDREATLTLADGTVKAVKIRHFWWK